MKYVVIFTLLLVGCAKKNPIEGRAEAVFEKPAPPPDQEYSANCNMNVVGPALIDVVEGHTVTAPLFIRGTGMSKSEGITIKGRSDDLVIKKVAKDKAVNPKGLEFNLTFKPKVGTVENGKDVNAYSITLLPLSQGKELEQCPLNIALVVTRTSEVPVVQPIKLAKKLNLNATTNPTFTVDVKAKDVPSKNSLELWWRYDVSVSSKENPVGSLTKAIDVKSGPTPAGKDLYRYVIEIDMEALRYDLAEQLKTTKTEFELMAQFTVKNLEANLSSHGENAVAKFVRPEVKPEVSAAKGSKP